jgi:hypothetical protein
MQQLFATKGPMNVDNALASKINNVEQPSVKQSQINTSDFNTMQNLFKTQAGDKK